MTGENLLPHTYKLSPNKPVIMYLHGFLGCGDDWVNQIKLSGIKASHLAVDLPGHGTTPYHDLTGGMKSCASQLIRLLDYLEIERCHLIGYSMGGRIALYLGVYYPKRFDRIIIESGSAGLEDKAEREMRIEKDRVQSDLMEQEGLERFLENWYKQPLFDSLDRESERFSSMFKRRLAGKQAMLACALKEFSLGQMPSLWLELPKIRNKILFLAGALDEKYHNLAVRMADLCIDSQLTIIDDAGHNVHFEQPVEYNVNVIDFLNLR